MEYIFCDVFCLAVVNHTHTLSKLHTHFTKASVGLTRPLRYVFFIRQRHVRKPNA